MAEVAKFYTKARRIPMLVGKLPSGGRIWGGPYTITQIGAGAVMAFALWKLAPIWAQLGGLLNVVVAAGLVVGTIWATGKIPNSGRNAVTFAIDAVNLSSNQSRTLTGQVTLSKPYLVTHRIKVILPRQYTDSEWLTSPKAEPSDSEVKIDPESNTQAEVDPLPRPIATRRSPADWTAAAATVAATAQNSKSADLTGIGQLLADKLPKKDHTRPTTPRED